MIKMIQKKIVKSYMFEILRHIVIVDDYNSKYLVAERSEQKKTFKMRRNTI